MTASDARWSRALAAMPEQKSPGPKSGASFSEFAQTTAI
jgi:hypothetical protein